jgi:hypothetical protein
MANRTKTYTLKKHCQYSEELSDTQCSEKGQIMLDPAGYSFCIEKVL